MFGFVKTEEKLKFIDNNDLIEDKKKKEKVFITAFFILSFTLLNLALYFLSSS
jgi:hypothetical protein